MKSLSAAERRLINRAFVNWARLAAAHEPGQVQLVNLMFDLRKRAAARGAIHAFAQYLERSGRYATKINSAAPGWRSATLAALGEIANFCKLDASVPSIPRQAPPIAAPSLAKQIPDNKIARVMREDKVVSSYMLYSHTGLRVKKPSVVRDAVTWTLTRTLMKDSFATRRDLESRALGATISRKWVNFFTVLCRYPKPTKASMANDAKWACIKLGLISRKDDQLAFLTFDLPDQTGHWRPTTFSSGGYAAFCATDHRDGLGRTIPLKGEKFGLQEFVIGDDRAIVLSDCKPLGVVGVDTASLVDSARIVADVARRT
jgi:hypothetical protein